MGKRILQVLASVLMTAPLFGPAASASVVSGTITGGSVKGTGTVIILDPTKSAFAVGNNNFDTKNLYVFNEVQQFKLLSDLVPDVGSVIKAGSYISSHLVVFDPLATESVKASLLFDNTVLGLARKDATLKATNFLGAPSVNYNTPAYFGLEPGLDYLTLGQPNANSVRIDRLSAGLQSDIFRVFTTSTAPAGVPEPASWIMMILGMGGIGVAMRRYRRTMPGRSLTRCGA